MTAQMVTFISGVVLLVIFALAGWYVGRRHRGGPVDGPGAGTTSPPERDE